MRLTLPSIIFILLFSQSFVGIITTSQMQVIHSNEEGSTIYVNDDNTNGPWDGTIKNPYKSITDALEIVSCTSSIFVFSGHYEEDLFINKNVKITGENKYETFIYGTVTISQTNNVVLSQFTITANEKRTNETTAIILYQSEKTYIVQNIISDHMKGIHISNQSSNNIIKENKIQHNIIGLCISNSSTNILYGNLIKDNIVSNIKLYHSSNNVITQNIIMNAEHPLQFHTSKDNIRHNYWGNSRIIQIIPGYATIKGLDIVIPWIKILFRPLTSEDQIVINPLLIMDTSVGSMTFELYPEEMPITTQNFINLVSIDFFDGLVFHRVIKGFVIQGGGYDTIGTQIESPFGTISLETHPDITHVNGAISMARTSDPDSATSQFFICDGAQHGLNSNYAAFGRMLIGFDTLQTIASVETTRKQFMDDWPINDIIITETVLV